MKNLAAPTEDSRLYPNFVAHSHHNLADFLQFFFNLIFPLYCRCEKVKIVFSFDMKAMSFHQ